MSTKTLTGRVALVTGGSRGIGKAIALALASDGASVAVNYRREADAAAEVVAAIEAMGGKAKAYQGAVDVRSEVDAMIEAVIADFGGIDILINNAGIASRGQNVHDTDPDEMERVVRVHALAPAYVSKKALPSMRTRGRGDIIMISSVATDRHAANGAPYNMGKAAMEALALTLAKEERVHGIRTNIVAPSLTVTDMGERLSKAAMGVKDIHDLDSKYPFGRVSVPEDVAAVVRFLVSSDNPYANGQRVAVDGGQ